MVLLVAPQTRNEKHPLLHRARLLGARQGAAGLGEEEFFALRGEGDQQTRVRMTVVRTAEMARRKGC